MPGQRRLHLKWLLWNFCCLVLRCLTNVLSDLLVMFTTKSRPTRGNWRRCLTYLVYSELFLTGINLESCIKIQWELFTEVRFNGDGQTMYLV
mmetsp:Transcript_145471/g.466203  ORF Transcript_145471/g.466203 Transcript_145471/m.466203 type:complete len:92 (+) Transcript_145471:2591-2866(+)